MFPSNVECSKVYEKVEPLRSVIAIFTVFPLISKALLLPSINKNYNLVPHLTINWSQDSHSPLKHVSDTN